MPRERTTHGHGHFRGDAGGVNHMLPSVECDRSGVSSESRAALGPDHLAAAEGPLKEMTMGRTVVEGSRVPRLK